MNKGCCFTGHRSIDKNDEMMIVQELEKAIETEIVGGVLDFYNGAAYGFDLMAAQVVLQMKNKYENIKLHLIIPNEKQSAKWDEEQIRIYDFVKNNADSVEVLSEHYFRGCMQIRNRMLVDKSDFCICYIRKDSGGTAFTLNYAKKKGLKIIYL